MKIRNLIVFSLFALIIGFVSCREDFDFDLASDNLSFSKDTLNLDTIFNYTNSQTYKLTIKNNQNKDILVPRIYLSRGANSFFKINVDGMAGSEFENVAIRSKDSIFIFVEIAAGEAPVNPLYEDEINFETTGGTQQVKLLSFIEKAAFHNTDLQENFDLGTVNWNNTESHVIFGNVVSNDVTIGPGTRIYFHNNASWTINGTLSVQGTKDQKVIFRTDKMDEYSESLPKTWNKLHLKTGNLSEVSIVNYAIFKGMNQGFWVENSKLEINNSQFYNNELFGLVGLKSEITARNLVLNNSDQAALAIEGGFYDFRHCTIANYFNIGQGAGDVSSLYISNASGPTTGNFYNNIIYNSQWDAIKFDDGATASSFNFSHNLIKTSEPATFNNTNKFDDPIFVDTSYKVNDLRIMVESPALGLANITYWNHPIFDFDIWGEPRIGQITAGAYQKPVSPEELNP